MISSLARPLAFTVVFVEYKRFLWRRRFCGVHTYLQILELGFRIQIHTLSSSVAVACIFTLVFCSPRDFWGSEDFFRCGGAHS